jgi:hypothetical protein
MKRKIAAAMLSLMVTFGFSPSLVLAASNTSLQQVISAGTLSTDVLNASQAPVSSPSVSLTSLNVSTACQTSTGTYGTNSQRLYIDNPGAANNGWVLSVAATAGSTALWSDGASHSYDFNSPTGSGCTNGQLSVDPSVSTATAQSPSTLTGVSLGTASAFNQGSVDSIQLVNAGAGSDDIWRGYLTGISISQKIPPSTPAGSYTIDLTQTVVAQ